MSFDIRFWLCIVAVVGVVAFAFWRPELPARLADRLGWLAGRRRAALLLAYWFAVPLLIYGLFRAAGG